MSGASPDRSSFTAGLLSFVKSASSAPSAYSFSSICAKETLLKAVVPDSSGSSMFFVQINNHATFQQFPNLLIFPPVEPEEGSSAKLSLAIP